MGRIPARDIERSPTGLDVRPEATREAALPLAPVARGAPEPRP
jgi:hypothetical protein